MSHEKQSIFSVQVPGEYSLKKHLMSDNARAEALISLCTARFVDMLEAINWFFLFLLVDYFCSTGDARLAGAGG